MRFTDDHDSCPWTVPVPVQRSGFTALDPAHDSYNVETNLGRIDAFGLTPGAPMGDLLYADLQTNADASVNRRLGSGRSGFYRGKYLKGMGRTPLAANWADDVDLYHNSGHMLPGAAIREYLVSRAFRGLGLERAILGCEGLLFKTLPKRVDGFLRAMLPEAQDAFAEIDRWAQAISIKDGAFGRFSNFLWIVDHLNPRGLTLADAMYRIRSFLEPPEGRPVPSDEVSPDAIARAFSRATLRGLEGFRAYLRAGVYWGSFHNNFSADGRFLDLEIPLVLGRPFFGVTHDARQRMPEISGDNEWIGLEIFSYARQARTFLSAFLGRLEHLAGHLYPQGGGHEFVRALADELRTQLGPDHLLMNDDLLREHTVEIISQELDLTTWQRAVVEGIVASEHAAYFRGEDRRLEIALVPAPIELASPEPGFPRVCLFPQALREPLAQGYKAGRWFTETLARVEESRDLGSLLERTHWAANVIEKAFNEQAYQDQRTPTLEARSA